MDRVAEPLAQRGADRALVLGMAVGVQEAHRDRLGLVARDLVRERARIRERAQDAAGRSPLGRRDAQLRRDQRRGRRRAEAVQLRPRLPPELDDVGEARGRDEDGPGSATLEQRIRRDRHPVRKGHDGVRFGARCFQRRGDGGDDAHGLVGGGRRRLRRDDAVAEYEHRIGERPADVDAENHVTAT